MASSAGFLLCIMFVLEVIGQTMFSRSIASPEKPAESSSSLGRSALHKCWTYTTASIKYNAIVEWVAKVRRLSALRFSIS
jgi:hypothetical protein